LSSRKVTTRHRRSLTSGVGRSFESAMHPPPESLA
jgi:hypothetical protein